MSDKTIPHREVVEVARQAGDRIMDIYQRDFAVEEKADRSPLTEADLAAHQHIQQSLSALTPHIPILSEESGGIDWETRRHWSEYWLVDPLDGTKEFIKKNGEFTVNIALVKNGQPIWGVVLAPALGWAYFGGTAVGGSVKQAAGVEQAISVAVLPKSKNGWCIIGSRSHQSDAFSAFISQFDQPEITAMGSSLKICLIAEGRAHLYPRLGPTCEWDTAAAHAVLNGAGGKIVSADDHRVLRYNAQESLLNPFFIAAPRDYAPAD
ncbi:3'(2'),5'-bisphosphate nucleotidase CysQ [Gilvimarinus algae]|uniref:3'(2'),5'-bisphosphate nucleotidase CysQ n=1 Tax=Gilvimarinus algae TaxID=3058037 RepID=A0ABT8TI38_9GAMM|nr:3'(2'),5'-bisphosphate nucleotidase CysQ [Gilvimarinus sp. SDUM040014]MDO3382768.1 3'(2'),5'-bisphosphate nucleotidase CysQ [Gilvimarinus sp. SDUM040014]